MNRAQISCLVVALFALTLTSTALARSSFRVQSATYSQRTGNVTFNLAISHHGPPRSVSFYLHYQAPNHSSASVKTGKLIGSAYAQGSQPVSFEVPSSRCGLGLNSRFCIAAIFDIGGMLHFYGTTNGGDGGGTAGTSGFVTAAP